MWLVLTTELTCQDVVDLTTNPGILPINLGTAKIQNSNHVLIHYFELSPLIDEFEKLLSQHDKIKTMTLADQTYKTEISNYLKISQYSIDIINEKLQIFTKSNRSKRGLVDGLGTIIKQLTGNLDSEDGRNIQNSINEIKKTQNKLIEQINKQYSINNEIIQKFNYTVTNIRHNEILLTSRLMQLEKIISDTNDHLDVLFAKDIFNQLIHLFNIIISILQDLENSITFCQINILHPSIITNSELLIELTKIEPFYQQQFPFEVKVNNMQTFRHLIKPKCSILNKEIIYFLQVPLYDKQKFNLYYFLPLPTKNFRTIIPVSNYILKSDSELIPLAHRCTMITDEYFCQQKSRKYSDTTCEKNVLLSKFEQCQVTQISRKWSLEYLEEVNQYLAIFDSPTEVKSSCKETWSSKKMQGTFLFKENGNCHIYVTGQLLRFNQTSRGQPILLEDLNFTAEKVPSNTLPKLELSKLEMSKLSHNIQILQPIPEGNYADTLHLSSTALLYVAVIIGGLFLVHLWRNSRKKNSVQSPEEATPTGTKLPDHAKF